MKEITLSNSPLKAIVDDEDYDKVKDFTWHISEFDVRAYTYNCYSKKKVNLARLIMNVLRAGYDIVVDHINHNFLDNRKENLRICTRGENAMNMRGWSKKFPKGVKQDIRTGRFEARIQKNYKQVHIGTFKTVEEAKAAYDKKAKELYGDFACS